MTDRQVKSAKLNAETAKISWSELQRHFARGSLLIVDPDMDLVNVALALEEDDRDQVAAWKSECRIVIPDMDDAARWHAENSLFWAVVVAPFVLVQEISDAGGTA